MISVEYAAGFFDGEGCVSINKQKFCTSKRIIRPRYELMVQVSCTNPAPLELLHERWGGSFKYFDPKNPRYKRAYRWVLGAMQAAAFLEDVLPFLLIKYDAAVVGLKLNKSMRGSKFCTHRPATVEELEYRDSLYWQVRKLNQRGRIPEGEMSEVSL